MLEYSRELRRRPEELQRLQEADLDGVKVALNDVYRRFEEAGVRVPRPFELQKDHRRRRFKHQAEQVAPWKKKLLASGGEKRARSADDSDSDGGDPEEKRRRVDIDLTV